MANLRVLEVGDSPIETQAEEPKLMISMISIYRGPRLEIGGGHARYEIESYIKLAVEHAPGARTDSKFGRNGVAPDNPCRARDKD